MERVNISHQLVQKNIEVWHWIFCFGLLISILSCWERDRECEFSISVCVGDYLLRILCLYRENEPFIAVAHPRKIFLYLKMLEILTILYHITLPLQARKVINMIMINGFEKYNKWMLTYFFEIGDTKIGKWHVVFVVFLALLL